MTASGSSRPAQGFKSDGTTPRLHEQFGYGYDKAWNLSARTNNELVQSFGVNNLNQLSVASSSGHPHGGGGLRQGERQCDRHGLRHRPALGRSGLV